MAFIRRYFTRSAAAAANEEVARALEEPPENIAWADTKPFIIPLAIYRVIKCYDGDTITVAFKLPDCPQIYRMSVRLDGIDCPEIKGKTPEEKECAKLAKARVESLILGKIVFLRDVKTEKYGRALATVIIDDINVNELLIAERLAVQYNGGTKVCPSNWMVFHETGAL